MTIGLAQQELTAKLKTLYEDREAATITDWVMEHLTGRKRVTRVIDKMELLTEEVTNRLECITRELLSNRPVQYVLGESWFAGLRLMVNECVLIPRPETEELVNWLLADLKASNVVNHSIIDIGTGSGCISISIKHKLPGTSIWAIDVSPGALQVARNNAEKLQTSIQFSEIDFLKEENWNQLPVFDFIVSNPPYIRQSEEKQMADNVLNFEPSIALFVPDNDPLLFYRKIALFGHSHLSPNGMIFLEINESLGKEVSSLFEKSGYSVILKKDLLGKDRILRAIPIPSP